jgi:hypothetical protein
MSEDLKGRTCVTCACSWLIEPPKIPTAQQLMANPGLATAKPVRICRLNPPALMMTAEGPKLSQAPTADYMSCWHWKPPGTLPGDVWSIPSGKEPDPHATADKLVMA